MQKIPVVYKGERVDQRCVVLVLVRRDGAFIHSSPLRPRLDLRNHSPKGFEWGYGGSGPAQLALAICADHTGNDEFAKTIYQDFKWRVIGPINTDAWELTSEEVQKHIDEILAGKKPL